MKGVTMASSFLKFQHQAVLKMVGFAGTLHCQISPVLVFHTLWWNINDSNVKDSAAKSPPPHTHHHMPHPPTPTSQLPPSFIHSQGKLSEPALGTSEWHLRADFRLAFISEIWVWLEASSWGRNLPAINVYLLVIKMDDCRFLSLMEMHTVSLVLFNTQLVQRFLLQCMTLTDYTSCTLTVHFMYIFIWPIICQQSPL